jgi:hypothetical protein
MKKIYSKVEDGKLLHIVYRLKDIDSLKTEEGLARNNVAPDSEFLQLATLKMDKGKTFKAHKHIHKDSPKQCIAQESWVVIRGSVKAILYDLDDSILVEYILNKGDCSMTFEGGHNYYILEDNTIVYEYKTGPYQGIEMDKRFLGE